MNYGSEFSGSDGSRVDSVASDEQLAPVSDVDSDSDYIPEALIDEVFEEFQSLDGSFELDQLNVLEQDTVELAAEDTKEKKYQQEKKGREVLKRKQSGKKGKRRGRPPKKLALKTSERKAKLKQIRAPKNYVPDEEKDEDYHHRRAINNRAAQRSRAKKKYLEILLRDSWSDLFESSNMTEVQKAVLQGVRTNVGVLLVQVWDIAEEQVRKEYERGGE